VSERIRSSEWFLLGESVRATRSLHWFPSASMTVISRDAVTVQSIVYHVDSPLPRGQPFVIV